jgi:hypothetical protein
MTRAILGEALLFFLPFAVFAGYLVVRRTSPLALEAWSGNVSWLAVVGVALVVAAMLYAGIFPERQQGKFVPAHMENGRLVPGEFR